MYEPLPREAHCDLVCNFFMFFFYIVERVLQLPGAELYLKDKFNERKWDTFLLRSAQIESVGFYLVK